eukprot:7376302-Prymnesium_polylepis.1
MSVRSTPAGRLIVTDFEASTVPPCESARDAQHDEAVERDARERIGEDGDDEARVVVRAVPTVELPALEGARLAVAEWAGGARVVVVMVALGARATAVDAVEMEVVLAVAAATATTPRLAATRPVRAESRHQMTEEWLRRRSCTLYGRSADGVSRRRPGRAIARRVAICRPGDFRWHRKDRGPYKTICDFTPLRTLFGHNIASGGGGGCGAGAGDGGSCGGTRGGAEGAGMTHRAIVGSTGVDVTVMPMNAPLEEADVAAWKSAARASSAASLVGVWMWARTVIEPAETCSST